LAKGIGACPVPPLDDEELELELELELEAEPPPLPHPAWKRMVIMQKALIALRLLMSGSLPQRDTRE
jgi:hypothetical protein